MGKMGRFGRFCGAYTQQYDDLVIGFGLNTGYLSPKKVWNRENAELRSVHLRGSRTSAEGKMTIDR